MRAVRGLQLVSGLMLGLLAGLAIGFLLFGRADPEIAEPAGGTVAPVQRADGGAPDSELARLRAELARESALRAGLEAQLAARDAEHPPGADAAPEKSEKGAVATGGWPDEGVLARAGLAPAEIEGLRGRIEAIELERLYVRDQATREGWFGRPRFHQQMAKVDAKYGELRAEVGDEVYDWLLFSAGRDNRVLVQRVMQGSAAAEAGLEEGDVLIRYDDVLVFDTPALQKASVGGRPGDTVAVDVERSGERIRVYLPRGPLGIGTAGARLEPDPL